jgi:predicted CopG family antitoxin
MTITIELTDDEVLALDTEKQPNESYEDVIHRLVGPLVARGVSIKFNQLMTRFKNVPLAKQAKILDVLDKMTF